MQYRGAKIKQQSFRRAIARASAVQRLCLLMVLSCAALFVHLPQAIAQQTDVNREYPLKALYVYNFGNYIEWPCGCLCRFAVAVLNWRVGQRPAGGTTSAIRHRKENCRQVDCGRRVLFHGSS